MGDNYLDALILELNKDSDEDATTGGRQDAADSGEGPGVVHIRGEVPGGGQDAADIGEGPGGGHFRGEVPGVGQDAADTGEGPGGGHFRGEVPGGGQDAADIGANTEVNEEESQNLVSPVHRSPVVAKYITSSSARRRAIKTSHCNFCNKDHDRGTLAHHLQESERCFTLYSRKLHVKTVDAVCCILFECLFCEGRAPKLFYHLEANEQCRAQYLQKFDANCSREAVDKVQKLKRSGFKSRRSLARADENKKGKKRKLEALKNEPDEYFLNAHTQQNMLSNYRTCIGCLCNTTSAEELTSESEVVKEGLFSLEDKQYLRRQGKYWLCKYCKESGIENIESPMIKMGQIVEDNRITFFPLPLNPHAEAEQQNQEEHIVPVAVEESSRISIMFPCSTEGLQSTNAQNIKSLSNFQIQCLLYRPEQFTWEKASLLYQQQLLKYIRTKQRKEYYFGKINNERKTLTDVQVCSTEKFIVGSTAWRQNQSRELMWKQTQFGKLCLKLTVTFPLQSDQTLATQMVQKGYVLSTTLIGNETGELGRSYFVHTEHDSSSACSEDCPKITLAEYVEQNGVPSDPDMGTYISSVEKLLNSYISNVIKSPASSFSSETYHFVISFAADGQIKMEGLVWPRCFEEYNLIQLDETISPDMAKDIKLDILQKVKSCISASSNIRLIRSQFCQNNETEAPVLHKLIEAHQIHICKSEDCSRCNDPPLPSLECKFKKVPESPENIPTCIRFLKIMKRILLSMSIEDIKSTATVEWLQEVWEEHVEISEPVEPDLWRIKFQSEDFYFKIDDGIAQLLEKYDESFTALYQYAIGVDEEDTDSIILRRLNLLDCYTACYSPLYLKAANSNIEIEVSNKFSMSRKWQFENPDNMSCIGFGLHSHIKTPLSEVFAQVDMNKLQTRSSHPTQYVFVGSEPSVLLKKVQKMEDDCFHVEGTNNMYQVQQTMVTRYFQRMNGESILLCELSCYYDYCGQKSEEIYQAYGDKLERIPTSDYNSVDGRKLPQYILCQNKDCLIIRKKPKVLMYKSFEADTFDYRYGQVLLFTAQRSYEDLTPAVVEEQYERMDDPQEIRVITANRRNFYKLVAKASRS